MTHQATAPTDVSPNVSPTSVSQLFGTVVNDARGEAIGRVHEFAVERDNNAAHVAALVLRGSGKRKAKLLLLPLGSLTVSATGLSVDKSGDAAVVSKKDLAEYLLLEREVLDQQIIDIDGHKVVRVNDVNLQWSATPQKSADKTGEELSIVSVEVGVRGASRRLLKGLPVRAVEALAERLPTRSIPWEFVDLIERDARRVRLKVGQQRLAKLHPSDIADILEELAPAEREALFVSLPEETAAETLEEVAPKLQKELLENMNTGRAADIMEEMDPSAAADVLAELSDEHSEAILEEMEPAERQEVADLLEFPESSAAGRMTTYFVGVNVDGTAADAVTALREFVSSDEGDVDTIAEIYLLNAEQRLAGVISAAKLVLAKPSDTLRSLTEGHRVSCKMNASDKEVAELFDKYNLLSLPVVDAHGVVQGAVHADQVIAQLRGE